RGRGRAHAREPVAAAHHEVTTLLGSVCPLFCSAHRADLTLSRSQLLLLAGTANRPLAEEMAQHLGQPLCAVTIRRFADGEIFVKIDENVRGRDVYIIQPTNPPGENLIELLLLMDAALRASAARITAVIPYFGYTPQHRKDQQPVAISAHLTANMAEVVNVIGEVADRDVIIPDDMIDTGGTMAEAATALKRLGARDIYICATHALLSGPAVERLCTAPVKEVAVTNTIALPESK